MSGSTTPGAKPAKSMSSRLLTMKFMQRSAASAAQAAAEDPQTPSPKRPRLSAASSPANNADLEAVNAALAAEERKRAEAVARQAAEAGESEWVLNFQGSGGSLPQAPPPVIVAADSLDGDYEDSGRMSFGNFKSKKKALKMTQQDDEDSVDSEAQKKAQKNKSKEVKLHRLTSISGGRGSLQDEGGKKQGKKRSK